MDETKMSKLRDPHRAGPSWPAGRGSWPRPAWPPSPSVRRAGRPRAVRPIACSARQNSGHPPTGGCARSGATTVSFPDHYSASRRGHGHASGSRTGCPYRRRSTGTDSIKKGPRGWTVSRGLARADRAGRVVRLRLRRRAGRDPLVSLARRRPVWKRTVRAVRRRGGVTDRDV